MTDSEIDELAKAIADLKRATKRNDPFLRSLFDDKGWLGLGLAGSIGITLFCLPAHFLTAAYGSFAAIPPLLQALLWAVLAAVLVLGGGACKQRRVHPFFQHQPVAQVDAFYLIEFHILHLLS